MEKTDIHCPEITCKFTVKASPKCLVEHMITAHNYRDIPCDKTDCSYVGYSYNNFTRHKAQFHGHGAKPTEFGNHPCPYSCKVSFKFPANLKIHVDVHENRVFSCIYCQYRNVTFNMLQEHLLVHFDVKNFACNLCPSKFTNKSLLNKHILKVHTIDDFICVDCGFVAKKKSTLGSHRSTCKERLKFSRIL